MESQLHRKEWETIIDDKQLYKSFRILKVGKARLQGVLRMGFQEHTEKPFEAIQQLSGQLGNSCG